MNIFFVDKNPIIAAQSLVDKHVVKMILESCQLLSTAHRVLDGQLQIISVNGKNKKHWQLSGYRENALYKATHINHPSAIWARKSNQNYIWLYTHLSGLLSEYTHRYNKIHKCQYSQFPIYSHKPNNLPTGPLTDIPCCMPDEYVVASDPIASYRNYYNFGKTKMHSWKNRDKPNWII